MFDKPNDVIEVLLDRGARPDRVRKFDGTTEFHRAVSDSRPDVVELFLGHSTKANAKDKDGQTPLHEAAWANDQAMVELLIDHGAAANAKDKNGDTAAHVAAANGYAQLFDFLVSKGADTKARNKQGETPLDVASSSPPSGIVLPSEEGALSYSVVVTSRKEVRGLLRSRGIEFDRMWIPAKTDVDRAAGILKNAVESESPAGRRGLACCEYLRTNLQRYSREYAGFTKGRKSFVICNMVLDEHGNRVPLLNDFTSVIDGGCSAALVVIGLSDETVAGVYPNLP
jgi:hypothetical protein